MTIDLGPLPQNVIAVGSRVTCSPPPLGTDQDWLVLLSQEDYDAFAKSMLETKWEVGGSLIPNDSNYLDPSQRFNSFTKGDDNVIATASLDFYHRFLAASSVAKRLNLLIKEDRIALFQAVLYANPDPALSIPLTRAQIEQERALDAFLSELENS